jgi:hypothetical protein
VCEEALLCRFDFVYDGDRYTDWGDLHPPPPPSHGPLTNRGRAGGGLQGGKESALTTAILERRYVAAMWASQPRFWI